MSDCNAVQFSDQMTCSCGNVWDMNDPYPPECKTEPAMLAAAPAVKGEPEIEPYDAGSLNDFGGGDVGWWHDYIRSELDRAHEFYLAQLAAAPQSAPTAPTGEQAL